MDAVREFEDTIALAEAPAQPRVLFRRFRGEQDYPAMLAVIEGSKETDGLDWTDTLADIAHNYQHLTNCDPYQDMLFVEVEGEVVGYSRVWWGQGKADNLLYSHFAFLVPEWRLDEIRRAMLDHNEQRLRTIGGAHQAAGEATGDQFLEAWAWDPEAQWHRLLQETGYEPVRYGFQMVRPTLDDIPDLPLPEGLEVRSVLPEHYSAVWQAAREAFRDEWEYVEEEWSDERFEAWQTQSIFDPSLWQVAWDGDQVAGMVLNFINHQENLEYDRKRGYTETICVRRPWRRRGLARALIARSFQMHKELGMTEAALGVDAENPNGALRLYQSMGFQQVKRNTVYRKPLWQGAGS
ncbi:MAG: GNAT family N-acetyltransferase [Anaerolineae bacterium]|jgi:GNAT superfamily N-acetyltransferase